MARNFASWLVLHRTRSHSQCSFGDTLSLFDDPLMIMFNHSYAHHLFAFTVAPKFSKRFKFLVAILKACAYLYISPKFNNSTAFTIILNILIIDIMKCTKLCVLSH